MRAWAAMTVNAVKDLAESINGLDANVSGVKGDLADVKSTNAQMLEILIELQKRGS